MRTLNDYHRTPTNIADYVVSMIDTIEEGISVLDLFAGDGALTEKIDAKNVSITSVEINPCLANNIKRGTTVVTDVFMMDTTTHKRNSYDYVLMNPPFSKWKEAFKIGLELLHGENYLICILPKRALFEIPLIDEDIFPLSTLQLDEVQISMPSLSPSKLQAKLEFPLVDFGTAVTDIVVLKIGGFWERRCNEYRFLSKGTVVPICRTEGFAEAINVMEQWGIKFGNSFKGKFIDDSYTLAKEIGLDEWRTIVFIDNDEFAFSTFFEPDYTPWFEEIVLQAIRYYDFYREYVDKTFDAKDEFLAEFDAEKAKEFAFMAGYDESSLEDFRLISHRLYQDSKVISALQGTNRKKLRAFLDINVLEEDIEKLKPLEAV